MFLLRGERTAPASHPRLVSALDPATDLQGLDDRTTCYPGPAQIRASDLLSSRVKCKGKPGWSRGQLHSTVKVSVPLKDTLENDSNGKFDMMSISPPPPPTPPKG